MRISWAQNKFIAIALLISILGNNLPGQILINEFQASNTFVVDDPLFQESSDWVELYNTGSSPFNLSGFYLTDNLGNPDKWEIPAGTTIPAKGYLLIWTDGMDTLMHTSFKLAQEGEEIGLFTSNLDLVDSVSYLLQKSDISQGRMSDGANTWGYFPEPTPGTSNNTVSYKGWVDHVPEFSILGGLFDSPVEVSLSTPFGGVIRYTLDGSEPSVTSTIYDAPLTISSTGVLRARVFLPYLIPGRTITHSYFVNEDFENRPLPIISIATDPDNFWNPVQGIYVQDFKPDWEVPINIELFENDGSDRASFNELAGTKVNGLYSWRLPQKMLGIYFRKQYGNSKLEYPLIPGRERNIYKSFALRASGSDWSYTLFRDGLIQYSSQLNSTVDIQGFRACMVFINGEYLGIHNIREKIDENYVESNHGNAAGTFDIVEKSVDGDYAEAGDLEAYNEFVQLLNRDLSVKSNYDAVAKLMDIEGFTDYVSAEIYSQNTSVDHNVMSWKPKPNGKWKWILVDLDRGFFNPANNLINYYIGKDELPLADLLENDDYKVFFGKKLADHLYTSFNPIRIYNLIDNFAGRIDTEMPYHIERWLGTTSNYGDAIPSMNYWRNEVASLKEFASARPHILLADLESYGFDNAVNFSCNVYPTEAGYILFNGLLIPEPQWTGEYPKGLDIQLKAMDKPGYDFMGWSEASQQEIIPKNSTWKYLDNGSNQGSAWKEVGFNDVSWQAGTAQLGYGDGDEQTVVSFGGSSSNKYITTYFRKNITLGIAELGASGCLINLLRDDGAVIYINGQEVVRSNMSGGPIDYLSTASNSIGGSDESSFISYTIDASVFHEGSNVVAVELHQSSASSSDLSFDLELLLLVENPTSFVSTNPAITINLSGNRFMNAVYEMNDQCIIPANITTNLTLSKECSPYVAQSDITIASGAVLYIEEGVEIRMPSDANIFIHGSIQAAGSEEERIIIKGNPENSGESWGALCFDHTDQPSTLDYVTIEDASDGPVPYRDVAAISSFYATLYLDHMIIENVSRNPIAARYSDITLRNSSLHSSVTGDLINVKYGHAAISNCFFEGNDQPDTDAIDYDDVENGIISNSIIHNFYGFNSDAIDIGEKATQIKIDSLWIYNITDKGISVGQQSTVSVENSVFNNCNMGLGLKDSCKIYINHCTFYGNATAVACFEKNPGSAGGNGILRNSILSNSYDDSYFADNRSSFLISYSMSDTDTLPTPESNLFGNPMFENPSFFDFKLLPNSPCIEKGNDDGIPVNIGSRVNQFNGLPYLMFNNIFYNPANEEDKSEFLTLYNPSSETIDLTGYQITRGIAFEFPEGLEIGPAETIFLVKDITNPPSNYYTGKTYQWLSGSLANEGEAIRLQDKYGIILDQVVYRPASPWPVPENGNVISLKSAALDNHFGENWSTIAYNTLVYFDNDSAPNTEIKLYPNPTPDLLYIQASEFTNRPVTIYSIAGQLLARFNLNEIGYAQIDLSQFANSMLFIHVGTEVYKVIVIHN